MTATSEVSSRLSSFPTSVVVPMSYAIPYHLPTFFQSRQAEVPPLREQRGDLPEELYEVVDHALEREPRRRFESAREMIHALTRILRNVSKSTDCYAVSQSVIETRRLLREA